MTAGSCCARDDELGQELWGPRAGAGTLLCRGQLPTRWHCWSSVGLPDSAIPAAARGCFWALSSPHHGLGRTSVPRVRPSRPHWEPPPGLSSSRRTWDVCRWRIQNLGMSLQGLGGIWVSLLARCLLWQRLSWGWPAPGPDTASALLPQMMSPQGFMGSCTSSSTLPRASSSQPVSVGAHPAWRGRWARKSWGPAHGPALPTVVPWEMVRVFLGC